MPMNLGNGIMQAGVIAYDLLWVEHPFPGWQVAVWLMPVAVWLMPAIIAAKASHPTEERTMTPEETTTPHIMQPYADAGHDIDSLLRVGHYRCDRCGACLIDLSEDLDYGDMRVCKRRLKGDDR